jgi:hypothetical protein
MHTQMKIAGSWVASLSFCDVFLSGFGFMKQFSPSINNATMCFSLILQASVREQETSQQAKATFAAISASKTKFDSQNMPGSNRDDFRLRTSARDLRPTTSNLKSEQVELSEQDRLEMQSRRKKLEAEWNNAPLHNVVERNRIEREINRIDVALKPGPCRKKLFTIKVSDTVIMNANELSFTCDFRSNQGCHWPT